MKMIAKTTLSWFALAVALCLETACAEDSGRNGLCPEQASLPIERACDIRKASCQEAVFLATDCVRGTRSVHPEVRVITTAQFDEELAERYNTNAADGGISDAEAELDGSTEALPYDHWDEGLRLLSLLEPEKARSDAFSQESSDTTSAYYSGEYRDITIIDRESGFDSSSAIITLSHEYLHALQDADVGLGEQRDNYSHNDDNIIALLSLTEGESNFRSQLAYGVLLGIPAEALFTEDYFERGLAYYQRYVLRHPSPYIAIKSGFHYGTGPRYYAELFAEEGNAGIDGLLTSFPISTVHWMAGYRADSQHSETWQQPMPCQPVDAPENYSFAFRDSFGAAMAFAFIGSHRDGNKYDIHSAWNLALEWRGDKYQVFSRDDTGDADETAIAWRLLFSDVAHANEFRSAASQINPSWRFQQHGNEVQLFAATDTTILESWIDTVQCNSKRD